MALVGSSDRADVLSALISTFHDSSTRRNNLFISYRGEQQQDEWERDVPTKTEKSDVIVETRDNVVYDYRTVTTIRDDHRGPRSLSTLY